MTRPAISEAVTTRPVVLDGGLATLLEEYGHDLSSSLWSARLLADDPEAIARAHAEFFRAGAQVATTASYQVSVEGFAARGADPAEVEVLLRRSVDLAARARDEARPEGWVAASVGPYGAMLADGSEYTGAYDVDIDGLRRFHRRRLEVLGGTVGEGADLLAVETIPCLAEVEAVLAELDGTGVPAWLSLSAAPGGRTRRGEPLAQAFAMAADVAEIVAVGVNCTPPVDVAAALAELRALPAVVYPNSGQTWDAVGRRWEGESAFAVRDVDTWRAAGARFVGGCCRVGPADIRTLADVLADGGSGA